MCLLLGGQTATGYIPKDSIENWWMITVKCKCEGMFVFALCLSLQWTQELLDFLVSLLANLLLMFVISCDRICVVWTNVLYPLRDNFVSCMECSANVKSMSRSIHLFNQQPTAIWYVNIDNRRVSLIAALRPRAIFCGRFHSWISPSIELTGEPLVSSVTIRLGSLPCLKLKCRCLFPIYRSCLLLQFSIYVLSPADQPHFICTHWLDPL